MFLAREVARQPFDIGHERRLDRGVGAGRAVDLDERGRCRPRRSSRPADCSRIGNAASMPNDRRHHVDLEPLAPGFLVHALGQRADIGDEDVEPAQRVRRLADPGLHRRDVGDVDRAAARPDALAAPAPRRSRRPRRVLRAQSATSQPSAANSSTMARPMPRVPPVTIAFLPLSPRSMFVAAPCFAGRMAVPRPKDRPRRSAGV